MTAEPSWLFPAMTNPAPSFGSRLPYELGHVTAAWREHERFTLLHDLTSCLRIGDVTEVHPAGQRIVQEIKASNSGVKRAAARAQVARAQAAVDAIHGGAPLPGGESEALWESNVQFRSHLRALNDAIKLAAERGWAVRRVADRVVGMMDFTCSGGGDGQQSLDDYRGRMDALVLQHVAGPREHAHRALPADTAARHPATAPFGIFPLDVSARAKLICDFLLVDFRLGVKLVTSALQQPGLLVHHLLPNSSETLDPAADVYQIRKGSRTLTVHAGAVWQLLVEFVDTRCWARANINLLNTGSAFPSPLLTFSNERAAWRPLGRLRSID